MLKTLNDVVNVLFILSAIEIDIHVASTQWEIKEENKPSPIKLIIYS